MKEGPGVSIANEARRHLVFRIMACDTHPSPSNICPRQGQREVGEEREVDQAEESRKNSEGDADEVFYLQHTAAGGKLHLQRR